MIVTKMNTKIAEAIFKANEILHHESEFTRHYTGAGFIEFVPDMASGDFLRFMLVQSAWLQANDVEVKLWRPYWRWTSAYAMTKGESINLNKYKLNRSVASIVGSIVHELAHIVDGQITSNRYWHGTNKRYDSDFPEGKRRTTPYILGELAKDYVETGHLYSVEQLLRWPRKWS